MSNPGDNHEKNHTHINCICSLDGTAGLRNDARRIRIY